MSDVPPLGWQAEQISMILRRAAPDQLEKAELLDQSGLQVDEFRVGVAELESAGLLDEAADHYGWRPPGSGPTAPPPDSDEAEEADAAPRVRDVEPIANAPATGPTYRADYRVVVQFAATRGEGRDEAALKRATTIGERLAEFSGGAVEMDALDAFDAPRRVFGGADESDAAPGVEAPPEAERG